MNDLLQRVASFIEEHRLLAGIERLLVGCSGGGDSVVLLEVLRELAAGRPLELAVAHLHHGWRGADADADAEHVRQLAAERGLSFFIEQVDLTARVGSREEVARRARLQFFERLAADWPADAVALGHSADDQAETLIMNLCRGAGLRGLGGMRPRARIGSLLVIRPLLGQRRAGLRDWARARGLEWRHDASNADLSLTRNRVRHRLLPELEGVHPGAVDNLARAAALLQEEEEWLAGEAASRYDQMVRPDEFPGAVALDLEALRKAPRALQRRLVRVAAAAVRGDTAGLEAAHIESVVDALVGGEATAHDLPGTRARIEGKRLRFLPLEGRRLAVPDDID